MSRGPSSLAAGAVGGTSRTDFFRCFFAEDDFGNVRLLCLNHSERAIQEKLYVLEGYVPEAGKCPPREEGGVRLGGQAHFRFQGFFFGFYACWHRSLPGRKG
jgi:hypothetical protein